MIKNKLQNGRPMLEMLTVLILGVVLTIFGLFAFSRMIYSYKADALLNYINTVHATVRARGDAVVSLGEGLDDPDVGVPCEKVVQNVPSALESCIVTRICGCGSNTELKTKQACSLNCNLHDVQCNLRKDSKTCVVTVTAYFQAGEEGAAGALESRLGLEIRDGLESENREFIKANCGKDLPKECAHGYAKCVRDRANCPDVSRRVLGH